MALCVKDLPIGAKIKFGAHRVGKEDAHLIRWIKAHGDNSFISEYIEDLRALDAKEQGRHGDNRYSVSNLRQYLNSAGPEWYAPQTGTDTPPLREYLYNGEGEYVNRPGFLYHFAEWERETLVLTELGLVFIPRLFNIFAVGEHGLCHPLSELEEADCMQWEFFAGGTSVATELTDECWRECTCTDKPNDVASAWYWHVVMPCTRENQCDPGEVYIVRPGCERAVCRTWAEDDGVGVRPAIMLPPEAVVYDDPDEDGYYRLIPHDIEAINVSDDEFLSLFS